MTEINLRTESLAEPRPASASPAAQGSGDRFDRVLSDVEPSRDRSGARRDDVAKSAASAKKPSASGNEPTSTDRSDTTSAGPPVAVGNGAEGSEKLGETATTADSTSIGDAQPVEPATERDILWQRLSQLRSESGEPVFSDTADIDALTDLLMAARESPEPASPASEFAALLTQLQNITATLLAGGQPAGTAGGQPAVTAGGRPAGTAVGRPAVTAGDQPAGTAVGQPAATAVGQLAGTAVGQPAGTAVGQPAATAVGQPAGTAVGQPTGAAVTPPPVDIATGPEGGSKLADYIARLLAHSETAGQPGDPATRSAVPDPARQMEALKAFAAFLKIGASASATTTASASANGNPATLNLAEPNTPALLEGRHKQLPGRPGMPNGQTAGPASLNGSPIVDLTAATPAKDSPGRPMIGLLNSSAPDDADGLLARLTVPATGAASTTAVPQRMPSPGSVLASSQDVPAITVPQAEALNAMTTAQVMLGGPSQQAGQPTAHTVQPAVLASTVAVDIARFAQRGEARFEIRLDPPELGRVDVRLRVADDGMVRAHLFVERSETLDLFLRDAKALERALEQNGLKTTQNSLEFSLSSDGAGNGNAEGADSAPGGLAEDGDEHEPIVDHATANYHMALTRDGRVDIRV